MKTKIALVSLCLLTLCLTNNSLFGQVFSDKEADSIRQDKLYNYTLPILGEKATRAGYKLPYSAGVSVNYLWQESELIINNLSVGFNNGPMANLDEIIRFDNAISTTNSVNVRPDIWLLPFLNVYGIFARTQASTQVDFSINIPSETGNSEIASLSTLAEFDAVTTGFGITPTIGVKGGFVALDLNVAWTDIDALAEPAFSFVFGPRFGKTFDLKKEDRKLAFWAGGFRAYINTGTTGSLAFSDLFDVSEVNGKIDNAYINLEDRQNELDTWWNALSPIEQVNPGNKVRYETTQRLINKGNDFVGRLDNAASRAEESTVQYGLDKKQKDLWNFVLGTQLQLNRHIMLRAEYGFLGSRTQFIGGLQYRFGL